MARRVMRVEFSKRLVELCRGGGVGLPRRAVDRHILCRSAVLSLPTDTDLSETEVNTHLMSWLGVTGLTLDYVTWRRHLVDAGYLTRDRARSRYRVSGPAPEVTGVLFDPDVETIDVAVALAEAREQERARKQAWRAGGPAPR